MRHRDIIDIYIYIYIYIYIKLVLSLRRRFSAARRTAVSVLSVRPFVLEKDVLGASVTDRNTCIRSGIKIDAHVLRVD